MLVESHVTGLLLWAAGFCLWIILIYGFLTAEIVRSIKPPLSEGMHGGWLVLVVATQSLAVLAPLVAQTGEQLRNDLLFFSAVSLYFLGWALYVVLVTLIFYRLLYFTLEPEGFTPSYWINMGSIAITAVAGCLLAQRGSAIFFMNEMAPLLKGLAFFSWVLATWWLPLLILLEIWRDFLKKIPVHYGPDYWDIVFPLGMYSVASFELGRTIGYPFLGIVSEAVFYPALILWIITFAGVAVSVFRRIVPTRIP